MRRFFGLFLSVILACASALAADEYKIDPRHSNVNFSVTHMTVSTVRGRFTDFDGKIVYDDKDISKSSVNVTIKVASITTDVPQRDNHLRSPDFFDAANHPDITFQNASLTINRQDFGVAWNRPFNNGFAVSNDVKIDISVEADLPLEPVQIPAAK